MRKAFKYRLYPIKEQEQALTETLETHRRLYNQALAERKTAWMERRESISYGQQSAHLKEERTTNPFLARTNFSSCQATLRRLDRAFQTFFRRLKADETPGYPRFKGKSRFDTVEFPSYGDGCKLDGALVYFQHIGRVTIKLHRPVEGTIKTISCKREADGWHVVFSCEVPDAEVPPSPLPATGIDLGLKVFLVTADGREIVPPRYCRKAQAALRRVQRALARKQKGSNRRKKAVQRLAKHHLHVANQRRNFHHQVARQLTGQYGLIAHEALNIQGIARSRLARSTHDVGWGQFLTILHSKAEGAGVRVIAAPPANTTQQCSACGALPDTPERRKRLGDRVHRCPSCGYVADRDVNAAQNILRLGRSLQALTWADTPNVA
ncbi:MAG TPA: transposase [Ktedonobacterales bacterium]|nr:transposase [Ktedonobacterales bacterium]